MASWGLCGNPGWPTLQAVLPDGSALAFASYPAHFVCGSWLAGFVPRWPPKPTPSPPRLWVPVFQVPSDVLGGFLPFLQAWSCIYLIWQCQAFCKVGLFQFLVSNVAGNGIWLQPLLLNPSSRRSLPSCRWLETCRWKSSPPSSAALGCRAGMPEMSG